MLLLSCCSLQLIIILFLCLQKHARWLLLHGNHLLVFLSCSAGSFTTVPTPLHLSSNTRMDAAG